MRTHQRHRTSEGQMPAASHPGRSRGAGTEQLWQHRPPLPLGHGDDSPAQSPGSTARLELKNRMQSTTPNIFFFLNLCTFIGKKGGRGITKYPRGSIKYGIVAEFFSLPVLSKTCSTNTY